MIAATFRVIREEERYSEQEKTENYSTIALGQEKLRDDTNQVVERIRRRMGNQLNQNSDFAKLVELIDSQKVNLGEFVSNDPRGKCLPDFLSQLHSRFRDDHDQIVKELEQLTLGVQHIKEVVRMQQSCAGTSSTVLAEVDPKSIIEDAIKVNLVSMERHKVDIERIYEPDLPLMNLDKHKILQILINLVSNAKRATCDPSIVDRQIVVSLRRLNDGNTLEFRVKDNGVGIEPQNVSKIFL